MSAILKTACGWSRNIRYHITSCGHVCASPEYYPGCMSVEYRTGPDGREAVRRVILYRENKHTRKQTPQEILVVIPPELKRKVARIVCENERNYRRLVRAVRLPDGEIVHA